MVMNGPGTSQTQRDFLRVARLGTAVAFGLTGGVLAAVKNSGSGLVLEFNFWVLPAVLLGAGVAWAYWHFILTRVIDRPGGNNKRFALYTALNRIGRSDPKAWPDIVDGLSFMTAAARDNKSYALRNTYDPQHVAALVKVAYDKKAWPTARATALLSAADLHRQPKPWEGKWWGTQPVGSPRPAKVVDWEGTTTILSGFFAFSALRIVGSVLNSTSFDGASPTVQRKRSPGSARIVRMFDLAIGTGGLSFGGRLISSAWGVRNTVVTMKKMSSRKATSTSGVMSMRTPTRAFFLLLPPPPGCGRRRAQSACF
jgi:hypothetical protein